MLMFTTLCAALLLAAHGAMADPTPVVLWHGMGGCRMYGRHTAARALR